MIGNMVVLWVFGDNVEAKLGHSKYLVFYMVTGVASALSHWMVDPSSELPLVGASGAIAGVMGAYLVAFPRNHVKLLVLPLPKVFEIPSFIVLGLWFILQLIQSFVSLGTADEVNVAFMSHIGGFITGAVIMVGFDRLTERGRGISAGVISMPTGEPRSIEYWSCFQCRHRWIKDDKTPERCPECARTNWHI